MVDKVMTILPPREIYSEGHAGAISLLVSRLAEDNDIVVGNEIKTPALTGGKFVGLSYPPYVPYLAPLSLKYKMACLHAIFAHKPSLVEVHNKPDLAYSLARLLPVRLILHNDPQTMRGAKTPQKRLRIAQKLLVCGVSEWVVSRFKDGDASFPPDIAIQHNYLDMAALPKGKPRVNTVLFAGRVVADKGVDVFVQAWAQCRNLFPDWEAVIIGADRFGPHSPETPFLRALRKEAQKSGVTLLGYQSHEDVLNAMRQASIVVVPSRWPEPFGMTALEAMGCGAAVIASSAGALPEVVGDTAILVEPGNETALSDALKNLMNNPALRKELGHRAQLRAAHFFNLNAARHRLHELRRAAIEKREKLNRD
ncbi:glycosyltransferase family 4 protein [Swingsia samuiensis]|nr:glycosyltransferase family 4 protein [Swingsia samuiensis]